MRLVWNAYPNWIWKLWCGFSRSPKPHMTMTQTWHSASCLPAWLMIKKSIKAPWQVLNVDFCSCFKKKKIKICVEKDPWKSLFIEMFPKMYFWPILLWFFPPQQWPQWVQHGQTQTGKVEQCHFIHIGSNPCPAAISSSVEADCLQN